MSTQRFDDTFAPHGMLALRDLSIEAAPGDTVVCRARFSAGPRDFDLSATASGPIGAMSEMLYGMGAGVEIVSLSQQDDDGQVTTYLLCERDSRRCWSYGRARRGDESAVHALIAGANQLAPVAG
ncbi:hypothetical protein [Gordonia shandongensis]|uniref:hypothetical protein n=1 Tax=Gordonia shandongensis TaxID=376351 RepID=UPI000402A184|nr:hypothetical protein [Gordonia shandongensis]